MCSSSILELIMNMAAMMSTLEEEIIQEVMCCRSWNQIIVEWKNGRSHEDSSV